MSLTQHPSREHHRLPARVQSFVVLIEGRAQSVVRRLAAALLRTLMLLTALLGVVPAQAQTAQGKVALDLRNVIAASTTPKLSWVKDISGRRYVKALIVANSADADMVDLRLAVLANGGSVYMRYISVQALSVALPADRVTALAARADVQSISPNRLTARTASTLEFATGVMNQRSYSGSSYSGLDGSGVGIAVLDSGIASHHQNFRNASGVTRVRRAVDLQKVGDATATGVKDWTLVVDNTWDMTPNGPTMTTYNQKIANDGVDRVDGYGHGSHVASVAAARGAYQALDSSGIAPGANLYDVKVLDANGFGQMSDVIAGIDWVMFNARALNIRVMNLSLAADSTESWQTDPLARAVRSATAAGITVVVAAGNYGRSPAGAQRLGAIASPGHEPSVITVGSANTKDTAVRSDDVVNGFSSRGPTRGSFVDAGGVRRIDNLLKPDLVAPGNRVLGAMATDKKGGNPNYLSVAHPSLRRGQTDKSAAGRTLMTLSGTSIAAPAVAGAAALLLQVNPGLTPPLVKAILQYTAQPIAGASLLEQGAGLLNVDGAIRLAQALRTDIFSRVEAGTIAAGAPLLAGGRALPAATSTLNGQTFN